MATNQEPSVVTGASAPVPYVELKDWALCFYADCRPDGRHRIIKEFTEFFNCPTTPKIDIGAGATWCILNGKVYGHSAVEDDTDFFTPPIKSFERVEIGEVDGVPHDLIRATTTASSYYYFHQDEAAVVMRSMLRDADSGKISDVRYHYVRPNHRDSELF